MFKSIYLSTVRCNSYNALKVNSITIKPLILLSCFSSSAQATTSLINDKIPKAYKELRVIYTEDPVKEPTKITNEIITRDAALKKAVLLKLDLVLVSPLAVPPVCKIEDYHKKVKEVKKKTVDVSKKVEKPKALKEMYVGAGIDIHDLSIKMNKVKDFLSLGHQVKVTVMAKKQLLVKNPLAVDEITLKTLELIEDSVSSVQQSEHYSVGKKEFILNPKKRHQPPKPSTATATP